MTATHPDGRDAGLVMVSLAPVSQEPPLVLWSVDRNSGSLDVWLEAPGFVLHLLAADQEPLAWQFARKGNEKFDGLELTRGLDRRTDPRRRRSHDRVRHARAARRRRPRHPRRPRRRRDRQRATAARDAWRSDAHPFPCCPDNRRRLRGKSTARRRRPQAWPVLGQLLVRDGGDEDRGSLAGDLGRQPPAGPARRRGGARLHAPDRALDRLRRRDQLPRGRARSRRARSRAARRDGAHLRLRHDPHRVQPPARRCEADGHRRPDRPRPRRAQHRRRLEQAGVRRDGRRPPAGPRRPLRLRAGVVGDRQAPLDGAGPL